MGGSAYESIPALVEGVEARPSLREKLEDCVQKCLRILTEPSNVLWGPSLLSLPKHVLERMVRITEERLLEGRIRLRTCCLYPFPVRGDSRNVTDEN